MNASDNRRAVQLGEIGEMGELVPGYPYDSFGAGLVWQTVLFLLSSVPNESGMNTANSHSSMSIPFSSDHLTEQEK